MNGLETTINRGADFFLNIGEALESRPAWLIGAILLFIPLALWGYARFCIDHQKFLPVRIAVVGTASFAVAYGASKLLLTAVAAIFGILSGLVHLMGGILFFILFAIGGIIMMILYAITNSNRR